MSALGGIGIGTVAGVSARRVEITVSEETWNEIEAARGDMPRAAWIKQALRAALDREGSSVTVKDLAAELRRLADKVADTGTDTV